METLLKWMIWGYPYKEDCRYFMPLVISFYVDFFNDCLLNVQQNNCQNPSYQFCMPPSSPYLDQTLLRAASGNLA